jgi:hypothetical protein
MWTCGFLNVMGKSFLVGGVSGALISKPQKRLLYRDYVIGKESLKIKALEHVLIEKAGQVF